MRKLLIAILFLLAAPAAWAQSTTVSSTITDAGGQAWFGGTYQVNFYPAPTNPTGPYNWQGGAFNPGFVFTGNLDAAGSFSQSLPSNTAIAPAGSMWKFTVCPASTSTCYTTAPMTITGASQSLTITPPAISIDLTNPSASVRTYFRGYSDSEMMGPSAGQIYWNLTMLTLRYWNGTIWQNIGSGSFSCMSGVAVCSLNTFTGDVTILAGTNITITPGANSITINSTGGGGSGTVSNCPQYTIGEYLLTGTTIGCGPTPPTVNGQYYAGYTVISGVAVPLTASLAGVNARGVTGTTSTDIILYTDAFQPVEYLGSVAVAVALPTPTTLLNANFATILDNETTGTNTNLTVTPATWTVNGGSTFVINQGIGCRFEVNPAVSTDWLPVCSPLIPGGLRRTCIGGLGDGFNAMPAQTYLQFNCVNTSGATWTITQISCWTDNAGSSTLVAANNAATALLTGAVTCNNTKASGGAAGTQSATVTLASGDAISFTFVADGTSKQTTWSVAFTQ